MYSKAIRMAQIKASRNDPKARLPRWYRIVHQILRPMLILPLVSAVLVKYHMQTEVAITKKLQARINATIHKNAKNKYITRYLVVEDHSTVLY
mmetsp:Transcript_34670/g.33858  ORF Transcript_34670/g.33858 Transcript_34670/m.33858 type:complete len:93 (+) Transcript_34670:602-880(+)